MVIPRALLPSLLLCFLPSVAFAATPEEIVRELNLARQQPDVYATFADQMLPHFQGNLLVRPGQIPRRTKEGPAAVHEAIRFLRKTSPLPPLSLSAGLAQAADDHCADQMNGRTGHGNPTRRINRYGTWSGTWGENIAYGKHTARDIVLALIIDDGLKHRKHRKNIFNPAFAVVGVGVGSHSRYGTVCTMDFAGSFVDGRRSGWKALVARN